jgi:hypothetical protein
MNRLRIAVLIPALTLGGALLTSAAYGVGHPDQRTTEDVAQPQSEQQATPSATDNGGNAASDTQQTTGSKTAPNKHPPTAIMDQATTPDKTPGDRESAAEHPPTRIMDRAAPDQRSPSTRP